jgi:uncharacterized protein
MSPDSFVNSRGILPPGRVTEAEQTRIKRAPGRDCTPHFMLVPSLGCPAACSYCFGPHHGPVMSAATADAAVDFISRTTTSAKKLRLTFHGGEPLVAGPTLFRRVLDGLADRCAPRRIDVALQSNLWLADDEFCQLFREYRVEVGTSLDGPKEITDRQRGPGYYAKTMRGIRRVQSSGLSVGCIATFTPESAPRWREVFDFFRSEQLDFSIHAAVPSLEHPTSPFALPPERYGDLLCEMLDYYVEHRRELTVSSLDHLYRSLAGGEGKVCSLRDCLGMFLAIDPAGDIYPCQRFAGRPAFRLGNLRDALTPDRLFSSPVARRFTDRQEKIHAECRDCAHLPYCEGGCPYNTWAAGNAATARDPHCAAYRRAFDHIQRRLTAEMAAEENLRAITESPLPERGHPLLRRGPLIELAREGPHPSQVARTAKRIVAAVELARAPDLATAAARLVASGVCRTAQSATASLENLRRQLHPEGTPLNNIYLHVTFDCQLRCSHCYACAGNGRAKSEQHSEMSPEALAILVRESHTAGFQKIIITGGEPLLHSQRDRLLDALTVLRPELRPTALALRTNFALPFTPDDLSRIGAAFDQVIVSVDGDECTHDSRRGAGTYAATVRNLGAYMAAVGAANGSADRWAELSLACVLPAADIRGEAGESVRALARSLGVKRTRFRPLLPLGRAAGWPEPPASEALGSHLDPRELIESGFQPVASCGLGQNLYVEPDGAAFPCYAYHLHHARLGRATGDGLRAVLDREAFRELARHTVDTNPKCRACEVRYLCGGACRAWGGAATQHDLDALPPECVGLKRRAEALLADAERFLELKPQSWEDV